MSATFETVTIVHETCCRCHVVFGIPLSMKNRLLDLREAGTFYCPNGHPQHYVGQSDAQKLAEAQRKLTEAKCVESNLRSGLEHQRAETERQARLKREKARKLKRVCERVAHGVCPCCNRTVSQLAAHMKSKHPDYVAKKGEAA